MTLPPSAPKSIPAMPKRLAESEAYLSSGKWRRPSMYVVGWQEGIVKVGFTSNGRKRWGTFLNRGAVMLDLGFYAGVDAVHAEAWMQEHLATRYLPAFGSKEDAKPYLGSNGAGYLDCFLIPTSDWPALVELARS